MPPLVLLAGAALVALFVLGGGGRRFTRRDLPKLRTLMLLKAGMGHRYGLCLQKAAEHDARVANASLQLGIFAGVAGGLLSGGNVGIGVTAARKVAGLVSSLSSSAPSCETARQELIRDLQRHDQLSAELGIDKNATYGALQAIVRDLGGFNPNTANGGD